jgi:hypothetical protein
MKKKQRRTLADVNVSIQGMAPPAPAAVPPAAPEPAPEATRSRENVATPRGFNVRKERVEKPHQSVYAHPLVFRELRKIAASEEVKPQELYREGLREVFRRRGLDFDALDRGEEV